MQSAKKIAKILSDSQEENDEYITMETFFIDSKKHPRLYETLCQTYLVFWHPKSLKDQSIEKSLCRKREAYFGKGHPRSEICTLGDLFVYIVNKVIEEDPSKSREDYLNFIFRNLELYDKNKSYSKMKVIAKALSANAYYIPDLEHGELYSPFLFPRSSKDEKRLTIDSQIKQFLYFKRKGFYNKTKGLKK